ncbi:exodeoxyribonuclease VII large subunit [Bartonella sp. HY406]|uniref:exodeoxyribonuclease VII large subunit n=1 Tax=Bartonella sp. HY406 TaxID=2979331 RepID=UPI0021CAD93E|nr:exodeoxyribonuclease VII large subunit [Bartonella sp. HY406]UXN02574.1 exodeoxyribonuclease VII large subunit [Bartonella sp. HY406]
MSDLFEAAEAKKSNAVEFTVSEISGALKRSVEENFGNVRVRGEISGYRGPHSSGHAYFALKDDKARLEAVIWRGVMSKLKFQPEEGMEVIVTGKLTTFPGSSKYQIMIDNLEPAGAGALMALLEERKRRFAAQGLFNDDRKRPLPFMPMVIGVITSPTGSVIRDIIHRISDRFPVHLLVWPVRVQGETSGQEVANGINGFNRLDTSGTIPRPDVLIVARGGGSLEDLWGFNDEAVVMAAAQSTIPLISAVGHETDWTLIDYVADMRAPTPTGAAEFAVPVKSDLEAHIATLNARLESIMRRNFDYRRQKLTGLTRALPSVDQLFALPRRRFDEAAQRLNRALMNNLAQKQYRFETSKKRFSANTISRLIDNKKRELALISKRLNSDILHRQSKMGIERLERYQKQMTNAFKRIIERKKQRLAELNRLMLNLSYTSILQRGFVLVVDEHKIPIKRATDTHANQAVTLRFADDERQATIGGSPCDSHFKNAKLQNSSPSQAETIQPAKKPKATKADKPTKITKPDNDTQGSLF